MDGKLSDAGFDFFGVGSLGGGDSSAGAYTGVKALMLAVLDNGIASYLSSTPRLRAEAEHWISAPGRGSPFTFPVVCETLRLEPDAVRAALRRLRDGAGGPIRSIGRRRQNVRRAGRLLVRKTGS
ncbi:MAG: hypothetical protein ABSA52_09630 [Candidatus Binatia bacterium]|jgi:hypothetical protein